MKYTKAIMEVVDLTAEEVILTSTQCSEDICWEDGAPLCQTRF